MSEKKTSATLAAQLIEAGEDLQKILVVAKDAIAAFAEAEKELETAEGVIDEQAIKIDAAIKSNPAYRPQVEVNKKGTVRINHAIRKEGEIITIDQIAANTKLIEELLKSQSSAVTLLSKD